MIRARQVAKDRFRQYGWVCNAQASGKWLHANTSLKAMELVNRALSNPSLKAMELVNRALSNHQLTIARG